MKKKQTPTKLKGRAPHWPTLRFRHPSVIRDIWQNDALMGEMLAILMAAMTTRCYHAAKHVGREF